MRINLPLLFFALFLIFGSYFGLLGTGSLANGGLIVGSWNNPTFNNYDLIIHVEASIPHGYSLIGLESPKDPMFTLNQFQCETIGFEWLEDRKQCSFKGVIENYPQNSTIECSGPFIQGTLYNQGSINNEGVTLGGIQDSKYDSAYCKGDIIIHIVDSSIIQQNPSLKNPLNSLSSKKSSFIDFINNFWGFIKSWFIKN